MEYEVRYYFSYNQLNKIISKLETFKNITKKERCYEKTMQFDHPNQNYSFYTKEVDGRFRIRVSHSDSYEACKISWKRRLPVTTKSQVNQEEEVGLNIKYEEYDNLMFIITNVLKMKMVESYERYRTIFTNQDIEIAIDEYPFGIALEIENKSDNKDPEQVILQWTKKLNLDIKKTYRLSWDDKYTQLCKEQNIQHYNNVTFDSPMPKITD